MHVQPPPGPLSGPSSVRNRRRNPIWRFRRFFFVVAVMMAVAFGGIWAFASQVELAEDNFEDLIETTYICTGEVLSGCGPENAANELSAEGEERVIVDYADIPTVVVQAVVATEDKTYFEHRGIDPGGLLRAAYQLTKRQISGGTGSLQGGSTITQQYIKLATGDSADDVTRKAREIVRAIKFEQEMAEQLGSTEVAKQEILERYLNRAYFGRGVYGVQAAARVYFDKDVGELDLPESAYLAGLLRNPSRADASEDMAEASRRREVTLGLMAEEGYITVEQQLAAQADTWLTLLPPPVTEVGIGEVKGSQYGSEYFIAAVRRDLDDLFPNGQYFTESLRVYTTLDPDLQRLAYQTIVGKLDPNNPNMPLGSLVAVDDNGEVVAMMGGADWDRTQVNLAMGTQGGGSGFEAGSQMKIFALAEYIEQGFSPESYYEAPFTIEFPQDAKGICARWKVSGGVTNNKARANHRTVYQATASSLNTVFAQIAFDVGAPQMLDMARRLGIESDMLECPSTVLGPNPVSPLEMAGAYGTIGRQGVRLDPILIERIEDADGDVLCWYPTDSCDPESTPTRQGTQAIEASVARQVIGAMEGVVSGGTGRRARLILPDETTRPAAGKTGTTQRNQHAWFSGFTCGLTTSVWVGYPGEVGRPTQFMNDAENVENGVELPTMAELFGTDEYNNSRGNGDITGGEIPAELWQTFTMGALGGLGPCDELPTERPSDTQKVEGLELLTTLLHCVEPDPALVAAQATTTVPGDTSSTETTSSDTTSPDSTETTPTTEPPTTETTAAETTVTSDPDEAPPDSDAAAVIGSGLGVMPLRSGFLVGQVGLFPLNNQQPTTTTPTTVPPTAPPTTDPCIPIDLEGNPIETTIPVPGASMPDSGQGGDNGDNGDNNNDG